VGINVLEENTTSVFRVEMNKVEKEAGYIGQAGEMCHR
jgi:hypothetical protein